MESTVHWTGSPPGVRKGRDLNWTWTAAVLPSRPFLRLNGLTVCFIRFTASVSVDGDRHVPPGGLKLVMRWRLPSWRNTGAKVVSQGRCRI
jgi:hypothetical protein